MTSATKNGARYVRPEHLGSTLDELLAEDGTLSQVAQAAQVRLATRETAGDPWVQGFAAALWVLASQRDEPTVAANIAFSCGLTLQDFRRAKAEKRDVDSFKKELRMLETRKRLRVGRFGGPKAEGDKDG